MTLSTVAEKLNMTSAIFEKETIKSFLEQKLLEAKTEFLSFAIKYKVKSIQEFDRLIKAGKIHETSETREDFFRIDFLAKQIANIQDLLSSSK